MSASRLTIPARRGKAAYLEQGQQVRVINTHGQQVIDTWAFNRDDLSECMSMEHVRTALGRIAVHVGEALVTTQRRPILRLVEDTSPGVHDTLLAACDRYRYELLGCTTYHDNCTDNLAAALGELGLTAPKTPSPWNLFMNIAVVNHDAAVFSISPDLDYKMSCLPTCCDADHPPKYEPVTYRQYRTWFMDSNDRPEAKPRYEAQAVQ